MTKLTKGFFLVMALAVALNAKPTRVDSLSMRFDSLAKVVAVQASIPAKVETVKVAQEAKGPSAYELQALEMSRQANAINNEMKWASWAGAVFGGIALIISIITAYHSSNQTSTQLRAYIDIQMKTEASEIEYTEADYCYFPINFAIKNVGQTPAMNCEIEVFLTKKISGKKTNIYISAQGPIHTFADGEERAYDHTVAFKSEHIENRIKNAFSDSFELKLVVYFTDIFGKERKAQTIWWLKGPTEQDLSFTFHRRFDYRPPVSQKLDKA